MKRGAIVVVAAKGAYTGKPRPALVVQSDLFNPTHQSITICPITSDWADAPLFRIPLPPGERTGLRTASQVMIDKVVSVPRTAITSEIGECDRVELEAAEDALRRWLGLD
ncbi:MAG TPA: type II toxin-antitoxin system PemK/MazF family toxin [Thermoanaerobaculia bacterium]|nr:type II toxin-antitoxin system PemK/MazF family toxin [Thermoanaerobaculia bacterium]